MLRRVLLVAVLVMSVVSLSARVSLAHKTSVFAHAHGKEIHGEVVADGDAAMGGAKITAYGPSGETLGETVADEQGQFTLKVTRRCDWKIVATGDGHRASFTVPADELPLDLPAGSSDSDDHAHDDVHSHGDGQHSHDDEHSHEGVGEAVGTDEDLYRQVIALRRDIEGLREKLRWQDILGGVGYILGLMGVAFYFLGSRRAERFPSQGDD